MISLSYQSNGYCRSLIYSISAVVEYTHSLSHDILMSVCTLVTGSNVRMALVPQYDCTRSAPVVERITSPDAVPIDATVISLGLDSAYVLGNYTSSSVRNLYANTVLFLGVAATPVKVLKDYVLSIVPQDVQVAPVPAAIPAASVADSFLAGILCLDGKTPNANPTTASANEDCDENGLLKSVFVGVTRDFAITGQIQSGRSHWVLLQNLGDNLANAFFYVDYARLYGEYGVLQLAPVTVQNVTVGSLANFATTAQVSKYSKHQPVTLIGAIGANDKVLLSPLQKAANDVSRKLWGFQSLNNV